MNWHPCRDNLSRTRYFTLENEIEYKYLKRRGNQLRYRELLHVGVHVFEYIRNQFSDYLPHGTMYVVVKLASLIFVTPKEIDDFIWGDHYTFFKDGNRVAFHKTQYFLGINQPIATNYWFDDGYHFQLKNDGTIHGSSFRNLAINNNARLCQVMDSDRERDMIRIIMSVIFNPDHVSAPISSESSGNISGGSTGSKPDIGTFSVFNDRTKSYNMTVNLEFDNKSSAGFGISSHKKITQKQVLHCMDLYLQKKRKTVAIYHV